MSVEERDPYTGHLTTGHDWNGIKELNSKVPKLWYICFAIMFSISVVYWIYMPAWPSVQTYTQGLLGFDQSDVLNRQIEEAESDAAVWRDKLSAVPLNNAAQDKELMSVAMAAGPALFEDNCAGCHGSNGVGNADYPRLNDATWLWSSEPDGIYRTLQFGINSNHPQSRIAQMPAFGKTGILNSTQINEVSLYVLSLSMSAIGDGSRVSELLSVNNGEEIYGAYCTACHGADAKGNPLLGAANLVDQEWLYGFDEDDLAKTITEGKAGHMPAWVNRLDDIELRLLSLYVPSLSESNDSDIAKDKNL